jgi:phage shock protein PspC (stress-responsive transcriptional regulator)
MNKVTTINLNGRAYQLEESGFETLRAYLDEAASRLSGNPDKDEIISDLEQAIAEKCDRHLTPNKNVVLAIEIDRILKEMGPVEADGRNSSDRESEESGNGSRAGAPKRLYRVAEGEIIGGVCNGIAAYFNVDVTIVRIIFIILVILTSGGWVLAYFLMMMVIPVATTSEEKATAHGEQFTAQDIVDRFKEGIQNITGPEWKDRKREWKKQKHEWKNRWHAEMHHQKMRFAENVDYASHTGARVLAPLLGILSSLIFIIWIFALMSVATTGLIFGLAFPAGWPLWVGIIILCAAYGILTAPLKWIRQSLYAHGVYGPSDFRLLMALDSVLWIGFAVFFLWLAYANIPPLHALADSFSAMAQAFFANLKS